MSSNVQNGGKMPAKWRRPPKIQRSKHEKAQNQTENEVKKKKNKKKKTPKTGFKKLKKTANKFAKYKERKSIPSNIFL